MAYGQMEELKMEITLTPDQEEAIIRAYGSVDYLQTYCSNLADYRIDHFAERDKLEKTNLIMEMPDADIESIVAPIREAKIAAIEAAVKELEEAKFVPESIGE